MLPLTIGKLLHKKMKFSIMYSFNKFGQINSFLRIWSHLLKKSLMKSFILFAMNYNDIKMQPKTFPNDKNYRNVRDNCHYTG